MSAKKGVAVQLVSGEQLTVKDPTEATWFIRTRNAYLAQTRFTEVTDLQDLDRLLQLELLYFRDSNWVASGFDYDGDEIDAAKLTTELRNLSKEINDTKKAMGLAKSARDATANSGDFATWFEDAKQRAKAFNFHRQEQLAMVLALLNELSAIVGTFDRSDEEERQKTGYTTEGEILDWVRRVALPQFREHDEYFRTHDQSLWVRKM